MTDHHLVAIAVLVKSDQVLLCHRHTDRRWYPNCWDVPGGHIEAGELPADAVRRELCEELGITIRIDDPEPFRIYDPAPDLTLHAWIVTEWSGEVTNLAPEEHDEIGWFSLEELDQLSLADQSLNELLTNAVALAAD